MAESDFVFESGEPIDIGNPIDNDYVKEGEELVSDGDESNFAFISGRGLGAGFVFYDDFEDGNYNSWSEYVVEGDGNAQIVSKSSPDGGSNAMRISETTGGGTIYVIGWANELEGWQQEWRISGLFYTENVPLNSTFQTHSVKPAYKSSDLTVGLGFRDGNGNNIPFRITGNAISSVDTKDDMNGWSQDTWYWYEVYHDGSGNYDGYCWEDGNGKPDTPNAQSTGNPVSRNSDIATLDINGALNLEFNMDHAFMKWK